MNRKEKQDVRTRVLVGKKLKFFVTHSLGHSNHKMSVTKALRIYCSHFDIMFPTNIKKWLINIHESDDKILGRGHGKTRLKKGVRESKSEYMHPKWRALREIVLKRDQYKCQKCPATKKLHIHHLKYAVGKKIWEVPIEWLQTLCYDCHEKIHGRKFNFHKKKETPKVGVAQNNHQRTINSNT